MRTFAEKPKTTQQTPPARSTMPGRARFGQRREVSPILQLHRSIGNQAVGQLLQAHAQELEDQSPTGALPRFGHDFSRIPVHAEVPAAIQPKLQVNIPGDAHEQEADRNSALVDVRGHAARGVGGAGAPLPHLDRIQSSFGRHDVTGARAHFGPEAADANRRMGAEAYTFAERVAFAGLPSLHTAAHEAAHVVQQRSGVHLKNNVGDPGDAYERHADSVAALVVQGRQAGPLLDQMAGSAESHSTLATGAGVTQKAAPAVQMQPKPKATTPQVLEIPGLQESFAKWAAIDKIKTPMIKALSKEYVNRPGGRIELPDIVVNDLYGGSKLIPGIHQPTEERVCWALYSAMDLKKTGKGDKIMDWSLTWVNQPAPKKKTADEKGMEIGKFATEQAISKTFKNTAVDLGVVGVESLVTGKVSGTAVAEAISEPVAKWLMTDVLLLSAKVTTKAIPIIGWLWLAYDIADLLISLNEPAEKELSPNQAENARIVAAVKAHLEGKEKAAEFKEALKKPFDNSKYLKPLPNDKTTFRPY